MEFPSVKQKRIYRAGAALQRYQVSVGEIVKNEKGNISFLVTEIKEENGLLIYCGRGGKKLKESEPYAILKIKVNQENWRETIDIIRSETQKPLFIDANQSWQCKEEALENINYLSTKNVLLIEQPFEKNNLDAHKWLSERSPIPIFADESIQRLSDIERIKQCFNGINIKLMLTR